MQRALRGCTNRGPGRRKKSCAEKNCAVEPNLDPKLQLFVAQQMSVKGC